MKIKLKLICILALVISSDLAKAQLNGKISCGADCDGKVFPYLFCDENGRRRTACTDDPNNTFGQGDLKRRWKPLKKSTPLHPFYINGNLKYKWLGYNKPLGGKGDIFVADSVEPQFIRACKRWTDLCPPQQDSLTQDCAVRLQWAIDLADMHGNDMALAVTNQPGTIGTGAGFCVYCAESFIAINDTPGFEKLASDGFPDRFFYTNDKPPALWTSTTYYSLYSTILHEVGHWLGFAHAGKYPIPGTLDSVECGNPNYTMGQLGFNEDRDLSEDDKCMYRKLYCCAGGIFAVDYIKESNEANFFDIVPNPANTSFDITLARPLTVATASARVLDMNGRVVLDRKVRRGDRRIIVDATSLANGVYMVEIFEGSNVHARKALVQR
ncbi:MAG: T9SS type A sorting domain-containing protein [Bacteroidota bacterium]